jgi:hypothetical protein
VVGNEDDGGHEEACEDDIAQEMGALGNSDEASGNSGESPRHDEKYGVAREEGAASQERKE